MKTIIISGDDCEIDKIIRENRIRFERGCIKYEEKKERRREKNFINEETSFTKGEMKKDSKSIDL